MPILTDQERLGTTIGDGKYTLERILGRGGMGTVFEALHTWTGRHVAVKLLLNEMALDVDASQRFLQEARSATAIEHPNVVEVLDMGRHDESSVYLVFELLRGESLADRLESGPIDTLQAAMILLPVADALAAAHRLGIVHRDVKPDNIFLEDDGMGYLRPKLLDFGIACFSERKSGVTRTEVIMGTPGYLSPEHAQGFHAGPASDVWSLGVVLFECITGYCPFESESIAGAILAIATLPVPSLRERSDIPEPIAELVERTLVHDPAGRLPNGAAFRDALATASQVEFVPSRSRSVPPKIVRDSDELSLSSVHRVEVRQSSPTPASTPAVHQPTPVLLRTGTPFSLEPPRGALVVDDPVSEVVTLRIKSEPPGKLDSMRPTRSEARSGALSEGDATPQHGADEDLDTLEASALLASLLPRWARRRRAAIVALPVLLLLVASLVAVTQQPTRPEGRRAAGGLATASATRSTARAQAPTAPTAVPDTRAPPSDGGSPASSPTVARAARAAEPSPDRPFLAGTGHVASTESRDESASGGTEPVDAGRAPGDASTAPVDAGTPPVDAGTAPVDASTARVDAAGVSTRP